MNQPTEQENYAPQKIRFFFSTNDFYHYPISTRVHFIVLPAKNNYFVKTLNSQFLSFSISFFTHAMQREMKYWNQVSVMRSHVDFGTFCVVVVGGVLRDSNRVAIFSASHRTKTLMLTNENKRTVKETFEIKQWWWSKMFTWLWRRFWKIQMPFSLPFFFFFSL